MSLHSKLVGCGLSIGWAMLLAGVLVRPAPAQEPNRPAAAASAPAPATGAPVVVFNRRIVVFRQPTLGFSAAERAALAEERIRSLLRRSGPGVVSTEPGSPGSAVNLDGALAFAVTPGEADAPAGETT